MKLTSTVLALALVAAAPAFAQDASTPPGTQPASGLQPNIGHLDVRLAASSNVYLSYVGLSANADYALLPLGPFNVTVGGEVSYDTCFLLCAAYALLYNEGVSDTAITPAARATIHFPLGGLTQQPVDVYLLLNAGLLFANHSTTELNGLYSWKGSAVGPAFGGGFGGNYFWGNFFFTGTEITVQWSAYQYTAQFTSGNGTVQTEELAGGGTKLKVQVFLGLRF
ncbi:MAG TPA: hypothetical protein VFA20_22775 [Myxococcaceae bacterium]|nr:hypothetical protein [Myxococcaceae bacterium]